jgi:nitrogen-specific signal transduction histidine kinase
VQRLFIPFSSTKAEGTGLGLTLAQQIVTEHGGHIECASAVGKGTTFAIYLPLAEES